jgi:hypothetical protein
MKKNSIKNRKMNLSKRTVLSLTGNNVLMLRGGTIITCRPTHYGCVSQENVKTTCTDTKPV